MTAGTAGAPRLGGGAPDVSAAALRALHHGTAPLVLPNVWDAVSARAFADDGFPALATSSSAVAATLGYADGEETPPAEMFAAIARIARVVDVPVTADIEAGYGLAPAELVERLLGAGAVGCNLEDSSGGALTDPEWQADRLSAVRVVAGDALVINARVDTYLFGGDDADAIARGRRYREAGADCVYPIFAPPASLPVLVGGVGAPVNALYRPGGPSPKELGALGASRVSFGGGLHAQITDAIIVLAGATPR